MVAISNETNAQSNASGHIFLSYSRADRSWAMKAIALLEGAGLKVWWDGLLEGGETFLPTTEAALEKADCVIVLWSEISVKSHWVRDEAQRGRERECLVPVSIDGTQAPLGFRQFQTLDASHWTGKPGATEADQILTAVRAQLGLRSEPGQTKHNTSSQFILSRRSIAIGGAALVGVTTLGAFGFNAFPGSNDDSISLAVTPFANLSGDPEQIWFSGGLSNELRAALARNPRLRVSAPTSSMEAGEQGVDDFALGRKLGVSNLLRGSVQLADGVVRITAELVQVNDGLIRWAESFDRSFEDVLAIQSEIASMVAVSLIAEIAGEDEIQKSLIEQQGVGGTDNVAAYEAYLRGSIFFDLSSGLASDRAGLKQFDAAIAADPNFAGAHAMRSRMLASMANKASQASEVRSLYEDAIASAQRAIDIAPNLVEAHLAKGFVLNNGRLDREAAQPHYDRARELAPGSADVQRSVAMFLAYGSEQKAAKEIITKVLALDPLNGRAYRAAGYIALLSRRYEDVISNMEQALEFNGELTGAYYAMGSAQYLQGSSKAALRSFRKESVPLFALTGKALAQKKLGDDQAAQSAFDKVVETYGDAGLYQQAQVQSQWGNTEEAISLLDRAVASNDPGLLFLPNDAMLDPVRDAPGFSRLKSKFAVPSV